MKKLALITAAAIGAMSFGLLTGFDNTATVDDVLAKYVEASKDVTDINADVDVNADINLNVPAYDTSMGISGSASMDLATKTDPLAMSIVADAGLSVMGEEMKIGVEMYTVTEEDGSLSAYLRQTQDGTPGEWEYQSSGDAVDIAEIMEQAKNMNVDFSTLPINFVLADQPVDVNGTECYALTASMTPVELAELVKAAAAKASEVAGEEIDTTQFDSLTEMAPMLEGVLVNFEIDVAADSYKAMKFRLDLDGTDWSVVAPLVAAAMELTDEEGNLVDVELAVDTLYAECVYDYATPVNVEVPADALAARQ